MAALKYIFTLGAMLIAGLVLLGISSRSFEYEYEVAVPARYHQVWNKLVNPDSLAHWYPNLDSILLLSDTFGVEESRQIWLIDLKDSSYAMPVELIMIDHSDSLTYKMQYPFALKEAKFVVEPMVEQHTGVTVKVKWIPNGFFKRITMRFNSLVLGYQDQLVLESLKSKFKTNKLEPDNE